MFSLFIKHKLQLAILCLAYCLILYAPLILRGGIIVDDWGNIASTLTCNGFVECYRQNFPIFANRPLAPLSITLLTQLFGQHYMAYLIINTCLYIGAIYIISYVLYKVTGLLQAIIFGAFACIPSIAMPIIASPINQSTACISILYWSLSLISTYQYCKYSKYRYLVISFGFLLASLLTYEITLPLITFSILFPLTLKNNKYKTLSIDYITRYILPVLGALIIPLMWQKVIGPMFIDIPSRLHFDTARLIPQFNAWAKVFLEAIPILIKKSFAYTTPTAYFLIGLFILTIIKIVKRPIEETKDSKKTFFAMVTAITFISSASLYMLSGAAVEVGGYGARGLTSSWLGLSLLIAGLSGIFSGYKRIATLLLIVIFLFFSLRVFITSRNNYINSWKLQNIILNNFMELTNSIELKSNTIVISNIPEYTNSNFNNESVFSTSWDFPAALRLLTNERVESGLVLDTKGGNFHGLNYTNNVLQADGFWSTEINFSNTPLLAYEFNQSNQKGILKQLKSQSDVQNQLVSWGYLASGNHSHINLNQPISFGIPWDRRQNYILEGWYNEIESWGGIWSINNIATIKLPLPTQKSNLLELTVLAFISPSHPMQRINYYINNQPQGSIILKEFQNNKVKIYIPRSAYEQKFLSLKFELPDAISPKEIGMSNDDRKLAIGLQSAIYR